MIESLYFICFGGVGMGVVVYHKNNNKMSTFRINCCTYFRILRFLVCQLGLKLFFWGGDKSFNATFFCCYFLTVKTFRAGINNGLCLFLSFSLYRQEKADIINYWHVMALSFSCCYFFSLFSHFLSSLKNATAVNKQAEPCGSSVLCWPPRSRPSGGGWFGAAGPLTACFQWRGRRLVVHMLNKLKAGHTNNIFTRQIWWRRLAAVFSHADCAPDNASTAGKDPSGFATVSVSNCCYLLIGFQHVALLLYSATERVCFVSSGPQRFIRGHRSFTFQNNFKGKTYQLEKKITY